MSRFTKGDLIFIPSEVTLLQFNFSGKTEPVTEKWIKTNKPSHALFSDEEFEPYCKILYDGQYWFAKKKDIYGAS